MNNILVVCEGNICRSPMAEGVLRRFFPALTVQSAGLAALVGKPADGKAAQLMSDRGIDISAHRAIQITHQICMRADLVLVMEEQQRKRLEMLYPQTRGRVRNLGEHINCNIPDPYRQSIDVFRHTLTLIELGLHEWAARIRKI